MNILVLNGVNLNMLGSREPDIYGTNSYNDLVKYVLELHDEIEIRQTNSEVEYIEWIQTAEADALIVNPGAWTHYSYAVRDALLARGLPFIEVHLSDVLNREEFRKISVIKDISVETISGKGFEGYKLAVQTLVEK